MAPPGEGGLLPDHYEVLGGSPDMPMAELKRAYHEKLREYHPDKRPNSSNGTGQRVTQALLDAWEVLQDPVKKGVYDDRWRKQREAALPAHERAEARRREGNELYKEAQALTKSAGPESLTAAATALKLYQAAIAKYSEGLDLAPQDHRIRSNRGLCFVALKDWGRCKQDAQKVTQMRPDFMKGWFLLAKALWKEGSPLEAQRALDEGLSLLPGNAELLALAAELAPDVEACRGAGAGGGRLPRVGAGRGSASRNVSPTCTPPQGNSRVATPPHSSRRSKGNSDHRTPSKSPGPGGRHREDSVDFKEKTPHFGGPDPYAERTARFGHSVSRNPRLPGQARSVSPTPAGERSYGSYVAGGAGGAFDPADASIGTFGHRGAAPCPPRAAPPGPMSARPDIGRDPDCVPQRPGAAPMPPAAPSGAPPAPAAGGAGARQKIGSLQGMVAASRVHVERMGPRPSS